MRYALSEGWHPLGQRIGQKPGARAYVVDYGGNGVPLILLHGIMVSSWSWRYTLEALHPSFRTIAICHKGFGWSDKPPDHYDVSVLSQFIVSTMNELDIKSAHIVGNSLGGAVAMHIGLHHPERVQRLALLAPAAVRLSHVHWLLRMQHRRLGPLYTLVGRREVYRRFLQVMAYAGKPVEDEVLDHFMAPLESGETVRVAATLCRTLVRDSHRLLKAAAHLRQQTLLCWGARDGLVPIVLSGPLLRRLPNVQFRRFEGVGHCPMEECPEAFALELKQFLNS